MNTLDVAVRGITIRFAVLNPRLNIWAERFEEIEPELLDLIDDLPVGTTWYDAGASIGLFTLYAAIKRGMRTFAFEPEAQNYATLELNHYLNRGSLAHPVESFNVALGEAKGVGHIYTRVYGAGEHVKILDVSETRDTHEPFSAQHVQSVLKLPLDDLIAEYGLPAPQALKIDVDGSEIPLLAGAERTLDDHTLRTVFIELADATGGNEQATLERRGFRLDRKSPVVRLSGGFYPELYNCVFRR
jgi:FkbM family methyltransferase